MHSLFMAAAAATAALAPTDPSSDVDAAWRALDLELAKVQAVEDPAKTQAPIQVGALIRSSFDFSSDDIFLSAVPGDDLMGMRFQDARLWATGVIDKFTWNLTLDAADSAGIPTGSALHAADPTTFPVAAQGDGIGSVALLDAWARLQCTSGVDVMWGQFKCPILRSSMTREDRMLFIDRTRLGQYFDVWQPGVALLFNSDLFHAKVVAQNGTDGTDEDLGLVVRGELKLNGGAGVGEGAMGAAEGVQGTIGAAWFDDGNFDTVEAIAVDAAVTMGRFSVSGEVVDIDDELGAMTINFEEGAGVGLAEGGTPWSLTAGFLINPSWEAGVRYQDLDDVDGTSIVGGGLNYYQAGHSAKWQLNVSQWDDDIDDGMLIQLGLSLGSCPDC